jgi:hypothetical protein
VSRFSVIFFGKRAFDETRHKIETSTWVKIYGCVLFKRLLSEKAQRASRGLLIDDLWSDALLGEKYLNDAATRLRHILSSEQRSLLTCLR